MINFRHAALLAGAALIATPALAQDTTTTPATPAQEAAPAQETTPQTAAPATPAAPAPVSEDEVKKFAKAALAADKVSKDTAIAAAEKQKQMAAAVTASGLEPTRFNEIAQAAQADSALQQRVQAAITAEQQQGATQ